MVYNAELLKDIIDWDVSNWSQAVFYWDKYLPEKKDNLKCLELGCNKGGLSLWLAKKGFNVLCSDLKNSKENAYPLHYKYNAQNLIEYDDIDATNIPYNNYFDIVVFKSMVGGISRNNNEALKKKVFDEIYKSLKPGGKLLFAENLKASLLHEFLRKRFTKWGNNWNYFQTKEIKNLLSTYKIINYTSAGFWGAFGRNESQRNILGKIDKTAQKFIPDKWKYILIGIAEK